MKDVNIKVDFNQKRICNNVVVIGGFMKLDENAIKTAVQKGPHQITPRTFTVWQALCVTYFKEEDTSITKNLGLSTKHIADTFGFNKRSVQDAIVELIEKGWLVNVKDELYALIVPQNEECENCSQDVCVNHSQGVCVNHSQGYEQNAHRGMSKTLTQSRRKEEEEVDSVAVAPLTAEVRERIEDSPAPTIEEPASEDATASSGEKRCFCSGTVKVWTKSIGGYKDELTFNQLFDLYKEWALDVIGREVKNDDDIAELKSKALSRWNEAMPWYIAKRK